MKILLAGYGVMGASLNTSWQNKQSVFEVTIVDPACDEYNKDVIFLPLDYQPDIIIFAVKPEVLPSILPLYKRFARQNCIFITIAAGVTLKTCHTILGVQEIIVRAMPNIPVTVGQGMTALTTHSSLTQAQSRLVEHVFNVAGEVMWLDDETLLNAVTAVSGSGPAYFFYLVESLAQAGIAKGLSAEQSLLLARQTAIGAGAMLQSLPEKTLQDLRTQVTSTGGTTEAGLKVLNHNQVFQNLILSAITAATAKAQELGQ
jgi:pyrroline-5-carboxylate reductase